MFYGSLQDEKLLRPLHKYYSVDGSMEIKENINTGVMDFVTYIGGDGYSAPIVFKSNGAEDKKYLFLQRDYQNSIVAVTDQAGTVIEKRFFDAWGTITSVQDGAGNALSGLTVLDRGYTGHEHLQSVGLINMNARLYDPKLHRFLQPDNNIQDPFNPQNYNRYGYVVNNPLRYTDPSGDSILGFVLGFFFSTYVHGGASSGEANPFKWDSNTWANALSSTTSSVASYNATTGVNSYIDNYNNKPTLGASAMGPQYADVHVLVNEDKLSFWEFFASVNFNNSKNRDEVSSLVNSSTFTGIGYGLTKFEKSTEKVADLKNFKIQDFHPNTKYDFITKNGITNGKIYLEGTRSSTSNLKYLKGGIRYLGYGASAYSLYMSGNDYVDGKISGSVFWMDAGMTGVSYMGPYGAGISAFYFMGVRNTPDYFSHRTVDFRELQRVQIDNTRVKY